MNKSVIVYGPQGCGKTRNAEKLREHFGLSIVVEADETDRNCSRSFGVLYLTNRTREVLLDQGVVSRDDRRVLSFDEALVSVDKAQGEATRDATRVLVHACFGASYDAGWWKDPRTGTDFLAEVRNGSRFGKALIAEKLCLVHSEVSEALEGARKDLQDDKLPHRKMIEVELADALIRICDLAGALQMDLGGAVREKMAFNAVRPDHKAENRAAAGGKAY